MSSLKHHRTVIALAVGTAILLTFILIFKEPGQWASTACILLTILISNVHDPKRLAGLGAIMGVPVGVAWNLVNFLDMPGNNGLIEFVNLVIGSMIGAIYFSTELAVLGLCYGIVAKSYKRGIIF
jgi:hypothetical protein